MTPQSLLLSTLVLLWCFSNVWCSPTCNNHCCRFVEGFPVRLKKLREDYSQIRDFYEANDDLDTALLDQTVEDSFKSPFACHAMNSLLEFYLSTVLPTALAGVTEDIRDLRPHMESIQQIFDQLKADVTRCHQRNSSALANAFVRIRRDIHKCHCHCGEETQRTIDSLHAEFIKLHINQAAQKAVGELDTVLEWLEGLGQKTQT